MTMPTTVRVMPSELASVTESQFPFAEQEQQSGVELVKDSPSHEFWKLIVNHSDVLVHPYYKKLGTIEDLGRQLAASCEEEIKLHADFCDIADKVAYIDEENANGRSPKELDGRQLMMDSEVVFTNWDKARMRVKRLEQLWMAYRNDRTDRLTKALAIYNEIQQGVVGVVDRNEWVPGIEFANTIGEQIKQLKVGVKMTPYFEMQNCASHLIQRPLFAPSELSRNLEMTMKTDPYMRSPITGSVLERVQLLSVAY